jgi:phthalate 4,5-cis-dihydrodiol dehydrogenase
MPEIEFVSRAFAGEAELFAAPDVDAVWIGPPNERHAERAIAAMSAGKHVIVEKPMALTLGDANAMLESAERCGVALLAGHTSYSYQIPIRAMRRIALSGEIGAPRAVTIWSATDWMLRPRPAEQADEESGAGLVHRQVPHQLETLRMLGPSPLTSVRASTAPGYYTALFTYADGMCASITHNGNGYFMTLELYPDAAKNHPYDDAARVARRRTMAVGRDDPGSAPKVGATSLEAPWTPIDLGMTILSCERGDVRHSAHGLTVYGDDGRREIDLLALMSERLRGQTDLGGGAIVQALLELSAAACGERPLVHDGAWGRASLEATLALIASARSHEVVDLRMQTVLPPSYDRDFVVNRDICPKAGVRTT